jgi:hypothetical protein
VCIRDSCIHIINKIDTIIINLQNVIYNAIIKLYNNI